MKRIVSFLLALVLTLSLTTNALAAVVSPKAEATEVSADQTVRLTVTASGEDQLTGVVCLNYRVYFDPTFFELDADASEAGTKGARLTAPKTDKDGKSYCAVSLLDTASAGLTVTGDLYTLAFRVKEGAQRGDESKLTVVKAHVYTIADDGLKPVNNGAVENAEVTVRIVAPAPADVTLREARAATDGITVTWNAADGAVSYNVLRRTDGADWAVLAEGVTATAYTDETAQVGTTYFYTVQSINIDGRTSTGFDTTGVSARVPYPIPADVEQVAAKAGVGSVTVTWAEAADADAYFVYRSTYAATEDTGWTAIAKNVAETRYEDTDVESGATYFYNVKGVNKDGLLSSGWSAAASATVLYPDPSLVELTDAEADPDGITVTWKTAANAVSYNVLRRTDGTDWAMLAEGVTATAYTDKTAQPGTTYSYTVQSVNADGVKGSYDTTGVSATALYPIPAEVKLTAAKASGSAIVVTWKAAANAASYNVLRRTDGADWTVLAEGVKAVTYTDKTVQPGTTYFYTVQAVNADGVAGGYHTTGVSAVVPTTPLQVKLAAAKVSGTSIVVTWEKTDRAVQYKVYRKVEGDTGWTGIATVTGTSYTDSKVTADVQYTYTVRGINADGELSPTYDKNGVSAAVPTTPDQVKLTAAKVSGTSIVVTWKQADRAAKYRVYRRAEGDSSWSTLAYSVAGTSYTDTGVTPGVKYTYTVRGVTSDGKTLSPTYDKKGVSNTVPTTPATVKLGKATVGSSGITVTWTGADGAVKYNVYRKSGDSGWTIVGRAVTGTSYTDKSVQTGVTYTYTVRGISAAGKLSAAYDKAGVTATALPGTVKLTAAKADGSGIIVTWAKADGAVKYKVYRKTAGTDWMTLTTSATGTSWTDKTAQAGVTYAYTVKALNSAGNLSASYDKTGVTATALPGTVKLTTATSGSSGITVTWAKADGAVKYKVYRKSAGTSWTTLASSVTGTSYTDKTVQAGVTYTYTVKAYNSAGNLSASYDKTGVTATALPGTVKLTAAKADGSSVTVTWAKADGAVKYRVYRKTAGTDWTGIATVTGTSWTDKTARAGTTYTYTVKACNSAGDLSANYDKTGVSAVTEPGKVTLVSAQADSAGILVTWKAASGARSYQVYRKTAASGWKLLARNITDTEWKDITAAKGTVYTYTVRAVADDGTTRGAYEAKGRTATVTKDSTTPANVVLGSAAAGKDGITVTWSYAADARTYRVYRRTADTGWTIVARNAEGKSWTDTNVTKGTKYTYTVRGVSADGKVLSKGYTAAGVSATAK